MNASLRFLTTALLLLPACIIDTEVDDDGGAAATSGASAASADSGPDDGVDCTPNAGDGTTQCGGNVCDGGTVCRNDAAGECELGCESTLNCAAGQWCDLRMPDAWGAGLCRPTSDPACGGSSSAGDDGSVDETGVSECLVVEGNYTLQLFGDQPDFCSDDGLSALTCSVVQDGCSITWGCTSDDLPPEVLALFFAPGSIEGDTYTNVASLPDGDVTCTVDFGAETWSCSLTSNGMAGLCEGFVD